MLLLLPLLATSALAAHLPSLLSYGSTDPASVLITIESSDKNITLTVPLNDQFTHPSALRAVRALYISGATGVPLDSLSCQAYAAAAGSTRLGPSFRPFAPAALARARAVGTLVCTSTYIALGPSAESFSSVIPSATSASTSTMSTSVTLTQSATATATTSAAASAAEETDNGAPAPARGRGAHWFAAAGVLGLGVAFAL